MFSKQMSIAEFDAELWQAIQGEVKRQEEHLELIASENYASPRVLEAQGSVLTNKYAEGYPAKRYYGGCEFVDQAEQLAISRAKQLFNADYANVQLIKRNNLRSLVLNNYLTQIMQMSNRIPAHKPMPQCIWLY